MRRFLAWVIAFARASVSALRRLMRPLLAFALVMGILGTVAGYMKFQASHKLIAEAPAERAAQASYDLEITLTFDAVADVFTQDATSVLVSFRGQPILKVMEPWEAGSSLRIENVPGVVEGRNEFYLEATPAGEGESRQHAARARILQADHVVAEQTLWSPAGEPVRGLLTLQVPTTTLDTAHQHE